MQDGICIRLREMSFVREAPPVSGLAEILASDKTSGTLDD